MTIAVVFGILGLLLISLLIFLYYFKLKQEEFPRDNVKINNYFPNYTDGYAHGILKKIVRGPKRSIVEFIPTDINWNQLKRVKHQKIVVLNSLIEPLTRGTLSSEISELNLYPPFAEDMPVSFRETKIGSAIAERINDQTTKDLIIDILRNKSKVEDTLLMREEGRDRIKDYLKYDDEVSKTLINKIKEHKDMNKQGGGSFFPPKPGI